MQNAEIDFMQDGTAQCLYTDAIPLQSIGHINVCRVSNVEFNGDSQEWEVWAQRDLKLREHCGIAKPLFTSPSRETCIQWEHEHWELLS